MMNKACDEIKKSTVTMLFIRYLLIYVVLVFASYRINAPGRAISDTLEMIIQSRTHDLLSDWHSPVLTYVWSIFDSLVGQPSSILLVQSLLFFVFPAYLVYELTGAEIKRKDVGFALLYAICVAIFIGFCVFFSGYVYKDTSIAALMLSLLFVLLLKLDGKCVRIGGLYCWLMVVIITMLLSFVRPTNFVIVAAVSVLVVGRYVNWSKKKMIKWVGAIAICSVIIVALGTVVNLRILKAGKSPVVASLIIFDVAGISINKGEDLFIDLPGWSGGKNKLTDCYTPKWWDSFSSWGGCYEYYNNMVILLDKSGRWYVIKWWLNVISSNPIDYIKHRLMFANGMLFSYKKYDVFFPVDNTREAIKYLEPTHLYDFQYWGRYRTIPLLSSWNMAMTMVGGRPFVWVLMCVIGLIFTAKHRRAGDEDINLAYIAFSIGLANFIMYVFFGVANSPRYLVPTLLIGLAGYLLLLRGFLKKMIVFS